jgi:hypothetical protein
MNLAQSVFPTGIQFLPQFLALPLLFPFYTKHEHKSSKQFHSLAKEKFYFSHKVFLRERKNHLLNLEIYIRKSDSKSKLCLELKVEI